MGTVGHRSRDSINKTAIGIRGEVNNDIGTRSSSRSHFDIEGHLSVTGHDLARRVACPVHWHRHDIGDFQAEFLHVGSDIGHSVPARQLDDSNALRSAVEFCGEVIQMCQLGRRIGRPVASRSGPGQLGDGYGLGSCSGGPFTGQRQLGRRRSPSAVATAATSVLPPVGGAADRSTGKIIMAEAPCQGRCWMITLVQALIKHQRAGQATPWRSANLILGGYGPRDGDVAEIHVAHAREPRSESSVTLIVPCSSAALRPWSSGSTATAGSRSPDSPVVSGATAIYPPKAGRF